MGGQVGRGAEPVGQRDRREVLLARADRAAQRRAGTAAAAASAAPPRRSSTDAGAHHRRPGRRPRPPARSPPPTARITSPMNGVGVGRGRPRSRTSVAAVAVPGDAALGHEGRLPLRARRSPRRASGWCATRLSMNVRW